jgi:hypothetical protein
MRPQRIRALETSEKEIGSRLRGYTDPSHARIHARHPRLRFDSYEARSTGSLDPGNSPTRTTQGRVGRPSPHLFTYSLTRHLMPPLPSTWIQRHRRGCSTTGVGAAPASNHAFLLPIPGWAVKKVATIHTTSDTVLPSNLSQLTTRYTPCPGFLGSALSIPQQPPQL